MTRERGYWAVTVTDRSTGNVSLPSTVIDARGNSAVETIYERTASASANTEAPGIDSCAVIHCCAQEPQVTDRTVIGDLGLEDR